MSVHTSKADWPSATSAGSTLLSACDNPNDPDDLFAAIKADMDALDKGLIENHQSHSRLIMGALFVSLCFGVALSALFFKVML